MLRWGGNKKASDLTVTTSSSAKDVKESTVPVRPPLAHAHSERSNARFSSGQLRQQGITRFYHALWRAIYPSSAMSETATDIERAAGGSTSNIVITNAGGLRLSRRQSRRSTVADEDEQHEKRPGVEFNDEVDVVVVDADFEQIIQAGSMTPGGASGSEQQEDSGSGLHSVQRAKTATSVSQHPFDHPGDHNGWRGRLAAFPPYAILRWRVIPYLMFFFNPSFIDPEKEDAYHKERWFAEKPAVLAISFCMLVIWAESFGLQVHPYNTYTKWTYGLGASLCIAPLFPLAALNIPRTHNWIWQINLWLASWSWPMFLVFDIWSCGFYTDNNTCGGKDFVASMFYPAALPVLSLMLLGQSRAWHCFGLLFWVVVVAVLLIPLRVVWARNLVNVLIFHLALLWASYLRGQAERRMFSLRDQLKQQYRATQKAQVAERTAADSKRKFVSYIFHEARVPLNTALIALQNLEGEHAFEGMPSDKKELVTALSSSLVLMEKVLNDVLDFNRMEAGRLIIQNKPFELHKVFRSVALAFRGAAEARKIDLISDLDPAIDQHFPVVKGDETRLLQVLSNLTSNGIKFTSMGSVRLRTRLLYPTSAVMGSTSLAPSEENRFVIIRIEVQDSGVGIKRKDLEARTTRLFNAYVQTEIGQRQGGKGSGLGLALIRQIVKLSGGRLGVQSRVGRGSTFWIELVFALPDQLPSTPAAQLSSIAESQPGNGTELEDRAKLVASQIPIVTDLDGVPMTSLPPVQTPNGITPSDEDPYKHLSCLVVDDDALTRKLMTRMLTRLGHTVSTADNGLTALTMLRQAHSNADEFKYQVVLLDNQMPQMNGVEVVREVRAIGSRVYVCGLTGNALRDDQDEFLGAGLSRLMTKPLLERALKVTLDDAREQLRLMDGRPVNFAN